MASVSTLAALVLDLYVARQQSRRGVYRLHDLDTKPQPVATRGPYTDEGQTYGAGGLDAPRRSEIWDESAPRPSMGPYNEEFQKPMLQEGGYAAPGEQYRYDTGYHGREA